MESVFVAMSGGFDSSIAAWLLKKEGYRVEGVTFRLSPGPFLRRSGITIDGQGAAEENARRFCSALSIPHQVIDLSTIFEEQVVEPFIEGYRKGKTPNPCAVCNRHVKFGAFYREAMSRGADMIATGHYARITTHDGNPVLARARDARKDQSYFLYALPKEVLANVTFPLGKHSKDELRVMAREQGIPVPPSRESQDVCFIPQGDTARFLRHFIGPREGKVYLADGTLLGRHEGIHLFTIGQRRGINIPYREALYVVDIHAEDNSIIAGTKAELMSRDLLARSVIIHNPISDGMSAQVRYRQRAVACRCHLEQGVLTVNFDTPVDRVTPGQSVVLYHGEIVAGGGIIEKRVAM